MSQVNGALTDLLFSMGELSVSVVMHSECDVNEQVKEIASYYWVCKTIGISYHEGIVQIR